MVMKVWMRVSLDRFRLPVAVANSAAELAVICGTTENCVKSCASHFKHGRKDNSPYICVEIDDKEDETVEQ